MSVRYEQLEAARRRMMRAQSALRDYEHGLKSESPDVKRFQRLYSRAQVCTEEYLGLLREHLKDKYSSTREMDKSA